MTKQILHTGRNEQLYMNERRYEYARGDEHMLVK
jgi:hypothetical protein